MRSPRWQYKREKRLHKDKYTCQLCGANKANTKRLRLEVHHITYKDFENEKIWQLITLCKQCHREVHSKSWWTLLWLRASIPAFFLVAVFIYTIIKD